MKLTGREQEVLFLVGEGLTNKQIATRLAIGYGTVRVHVSSAMRKTGTIDRTAAVIEAMRSGQLQAGQRNRTEIVMEISRRVRYLHKEIERLDALINEL